MSLQEMRDYQAVRQRLRNPPNAVEDKPIDLRPQWQKPEVVEDRPINVEAKLDLDGMTLAEAVDHWMDDLIEFNELLQKVCSVPVDPEPVVKPPKVKVETIIRTVAKHYGVSFTDILSARRTTDVVKPRQVAAYLTKTITLRSLPEIGRRFGRDHTTILSSVRKITRCRAESPAFDEELRSLESVLLAGAR